MSFWLGYRREAVREKREQSLIVLATAAWVELWRALTGSDLGVKKWGTMNLNVEELEQLCKIQVPFVNELDVPDCTTLADDFTSFAKNNGIQLWPSGGGIGSGECFPLGRSLTAQTPCRQRNCTIFFRSSSR